MTEPQNHLEMVQMSIYKLGWLSEAYLNNFYQQNCDGNFTRTVYLVLPFPD